ncbi:MAG: ABC transporter permease [Candidatus Methanomethylicus sp.]|nr:ABC transporter permease [Candidatus Methanomethylicus sp.]
MRASDTLRWGIRGIRQRKLRAFLTILGIMIGTAAIIALTSQTAGIQNSILGQINKLGSNTITITATGGKILTPSDVNKIALIPGVASVIPEITAQVRVYGVGGVRTFTLVGIDPSQFNSAISGASFSSGYIYKTGSYSEIVAGLNVLQPQDLTTAFLKPGQSVTIEVGNANPVRTEVQVVGSLNSYGLTMGTSVDSSIFMSIKGAMTLLGRNSYSIIVVKTDSADNVDSVVNYIRALYGTTLNLITLKQTTEIVSSIIGLLSILLGAIAGISLFVAGVGIVNIMFVSVMERTKEIGVLKAIGFKEKEVLSIFLSEASLLGIAGGISGILVGIGLSYLMPILFLGGLGGGTGASTGFGITNARTTSAIANFSYTPAFAPETLIMTFIFAVLISIMAGLYPARRASKMDPVTALRHE